MKASQENNMSYLIKPTDYKPILDMKQTELGRQQVEKTLEMPKFY